MGVFPALSHSKQEGDKGADVAKCKEAWKSRGGGGQAAGRQGKETQGEARRGDAAGGGKERTVLRTASLGTLP